jgi:extracellular matrix regulatory protein A
MLVQIGFGNMVSSDRIIAVVGPDASPVKRLIQDARDRGTLIDATSGRRTRSVILMDSDHLILSSLTNEELTRELTRETARETTK